MYKRQGLWHPNWNQNLKFAIKIQEKAEEMYPGVFQPIMLTTSRYNQHAGKYASIIEVGATGNTCLLYTSIPNLKERFMNNYSKQREIILEVIKENRIHPTAEEIYNILIKKEPQISKSTVYRLSLIHIYFI